MTKFNTPQEALRHHVTGAIERGEGAAIVEQRPFFAEGTPAMVELEGMVDKVGLRNVLYALEHICAGKAEHVATNWQDMRLAKAWERNARAMTKAGDKLEDC